jgi:putative DNA methylase
MALNQTESILMPQNDKRLIEVAFPLRQTSIDSVHEKNVRHGHISTLHIWPARRPLAACRAALIATLLPDPGEKEKRDELLKRLGGTLNKTLKNKKMPNGRVEEIESLETNGGVLHWGRETSPDMAWFREEIRKTYGGRAPRVLDPFAGGGAIPLEAMRLGCEVTAVDINPVAWFILKCTLEYPHKLAGQTRSLPPFALHDAAFMADYFKAKGLTPAEIKRHLRTLANEQAVLPVAKGEEVARGENFSLLEHDGLAPELLEADLAWHVRAWGRWVLGEARKELARFYPTYAEYCALKPYRRIALETDEPLKPVPVNEAGEPQIDLLNAGFATDYLANPANPRWVAKPTVAYLWTRTVRCKACRATVPLLKTRWLAKKEAKRVLLTMRLLEDKSGVEFGIDHNAKPQGGNAAQRREYDKKLGGGTMSRAGASCPCCGTIMTPGDLRLQGQAGRLGETLTAIVTDSPGCKEYRLPTGAELDIPRAAHEALDAAFATIPYGLPSEPIPRGGSRQGGGSPFTTPLYGLNQWHKLFTARQLICIASFVRATRILRAQPEFSSYSQPQQQAIFALLTTAIDKVADRGSSLCTWTIDRITIRNTFARFALPISWDFAESVPVADASGGFPGGVEWAAQYLEHAAKFAAAAPTPTILKGSAIREKDVGFDVVLTDPPYYDAIPYSDLMDFFYVWLRRTLSGLSPEIDAAFSEPLAPKWSHEHNDGELIDDASRFDGDKQASKRNYEDGMARAFKACHSALNLDGRLVIVFAHKHPDAWETLVGAIIKAGFVVDGSWPIQTEMGNRTRALSSAALSSSVWLVCKKRDPLSRAGWDTQVLKEMESGITTKLRDFWDAAIRGPDFIWAATGPALESYSRYPAVKKASEPGALMSVTDFLGHVRRIVVDFVVGRVLSHGQGEPTPGDHPLDDVTTYYLLHRNDFGLKEAPAGPCILYAVSCGLSERELADQYELLVRSGSAAAAEDEEDAGNEEDGDADESPASGGGGKYKLRDWRARKHRSLGMETASGRAIPLIDQVHKLMQLWVAGDVIKVNEFLDSRALRRSQVFIQLIQALIEKSRAEGCTEECSLLERLQNYLRSVSSTPQQALDLGG